MHVAKANTEYKHPFLARRETVKRVGAIVVTTDKGLCGGLNTNVLRLVLQPAQGVAGQGHRSRLLRDRQQGPGLSEPPRRATSSRRSCSSATARASTGWSGRSRCCSTSTSTGTIDEVHIFFTTFINTMKQEAAARDRCCRSPKSSGRRHRRGAQGGRAGGSWDYLYEPDAKELLDGVLRRYVEALVFQMVNENMASEQSARMVAMRAASDNAGDDHRRAAAHLQQDAAGGDHQGAGRDRRRGGGGLATAADLRQRNLRMRT